MEIGGGLVLSLQELENDETESGNLLFSAATRKLRCLGRNELYMWVRTDLLLRPTR